VTCCPVGKHPEHDDIDRLIRAQQAASQSGQSTLAMSYSQIARTYDIRKATLLAHRDVCLAQRTGTAPAGVPVRSDGVPGRTAADACDENVSDSARSDRYGAGAPALGAKGTNADGGRATGPPGGGTYRHTSVPPSAQSAPKRVAQSDVHVVVDAASGASSLGMGQRGPGDARAAAASSVEGVVEGVGQPRPPERSRYPDFARARARENGKRGWEKVANEAAEQAVRTITHAIADSELADPNARAHGSYIQEIVELIGRDAWENDATVTRLARAWGKTKMFVLGCYRDACALRRMARGSANEDREVSLVRWVNLYKLAIANGDALSLKVASDALKGYDAASGITDRSAKVQINIAQDPQAQEFVRRILATLQRFPDALDAVRQDVAQFAASDPMAILTTGAEVDAAE
jgi:hypothetical protein